MNLITVEPTCFFLRVKNKSVAFNSVPLCSAKGEDDDCIYIYIYIYIYSTYINKSNFVTVRNIVFISQISG
jgi:hypothetical protein